MLNEPTLEKLHSMKLFGMADAFRTQLETAASSGLSFEERFALLVDEQWTWRENRALARRLRAAKLKERGSRGWLAHWPTRRAATASRFCTSAPRSFFAIWPWRMQMVALAAYC